MSTPSPQPGLVGRAVAWILRRRLVRAFLRYSEHRGPMLADSITYRALFSIFAAVLLIFSAAALWLAGNPVAWEALLRAVNSVIPGLVGEGGVIDTDSIEVPAALSIAGIVSFVGLVGAAIGAIGSLRAALRTIGDRVREDVAWYWVIVRNLGLAVGLGAALVAAAAATFLATTGLGVLTDFLGLPRDSAPAGALAWAVSALVVLALDTVVVAAAFAVLSGVRAPAKELWIGALLGGLGLTVLQQLSGLFVGGATSNPLLATFASLVALLLWLNLSSQVVLIAGSYIVTAADEHEDRVHERFGAATFAQRRVLVAERRVAAAAEELRAAREDADRERAGSR